MKEAGQNSVRCLLALSVCLLMALAASTASAQTLTTAGKARGGPVQAAPCVLGPDSITQNNDCAIEDITGISCAAGGITTDTQFLRRFLLTPDHGITSIYTVTDVDFGVEVDTPGVDVGNPVTVTTYSIPIGAPLTYANMTPLSSNTVDFGGGADLSLVNVPVGGVVNAATDDLVVEIATIDHTDPVNTGGQFFPGANSLGQTGPSYIAAADCGIVDPVDLAGLGFPNSHNVMVVNGFTDFFFKSLDFGNDMNGDFIPDLVLEVGSSFQSAYGFSINYLDPAGVPVLIKDVVPEYWIPVFQIGGITPCDVIRADENRNLFSASYISCWPVGGPNGWTFFAATRPIPDPGGLTFEPSECGAFYLNEGAVAVTGRAPYKGPTDPICLAAVSDLNGFGLVYTGEGDEDLDGVTDYEEACVYGTDPCVPDGPPAPCGDCLAPNGTPGCSNAACEAAICAMDSFCCDVAWDQICADEALQYCVGLCTFGPEQNFTRDPDYRRPSGR